LKGSILVGSLDTVHFTPSGAGAAARMIKNKDSKFPAVRLLPVAAEANETIFWDGQYKGNRYVRTKPRTVAEVYQLLTSTTPN
jgi:hypothetical protein